MAGKEGPIEPDTTIPTNGFQVAVKQNECLNADDVVRLFSDFLAGGDRPSDYRWRDITDRFL